MTRLKRLAYCGRVLSDSDMGMAVKLTGSGADARAGISGLQTCGSTWCCAVCAEKIGAHRQAELEAGIDAWTATGGVVLFGTLTVRHNKGHSLAELWDAISPAWNRTTSGAGVAWNGSKRPGGDMGDKARFGIEGYVRVVEVKHGLNGWHPHIHFLLFCRDELTGAQLLDLERRMFGRWEAALAKAGLSVIRSVGIDLREYTTGSLAGYFAKSLYRGHEKAGSLSAGRLAYELTGSSTKKLGKRAGRTPFELLADIALLRSVVDFRTGEVLVPDTLDLAAVADHHDTALRLWLEWEQASHGRRQLTWSRGMRDRLLLAAEQTDEQIAEADDLDGAVVAYVPRDDARRTKAWYHVLALMEAAELGGAPGARAAVGALIGRDLDQIAAYESDRQRAVVSAPLRR